MRNQMVKKQDDAETYLYSIYNWAKIPLGVIKSLADPALFIFIIVTGGEKLSVSLNGGGRDSKIIQRLFLPVKFIASPAYCVTEKVTEFFIPITLKLLFERMDPKNPYARDLIRLGNDLGITLAGNHFVCKKIQGLQQSFNPDGTKDMSSDSNPQAKM